ncbi:MAG: MBL fold metallo-hydrolase [Anaerolineales bacterium]|nr:MBL fold metallo-hydrolase [Anaerolineales bacterium]
MIQQERVAENVYFFQSRVYAEVNAGVIAGPDMAVVVDTLPFPDETVIIRNFIEQELQVPVRYVINTHYHADHTWGNYLFPGAKIIGHNLCRKMLIQKGIPALERAQETNPSLRPIKIVLPQITFDQGEISINVGKKNLRIFPLPGHTMDNLAVLVDEDRVLFTGDTLMALPYIVDGDIDISIESMQKIKELGLENVVQGHGDIILRGEVNLVVDEAIEYLEQVRKAVKKASRRKYPLDLLEEIDIESCGKSRVLLGGLSPELHFNNLKALYRQMYNEEPVGSEIYYEE